MNNLNNNNPNDQINEVRITLEEAREISILLSKSPSFDSVAAALSLYLALVSRGKQISIACPDQMTVAFNQLIAVDKIKNNISPTGNKNLIISFPYQEGSIEKVSYNIDKDKFNLVIEPREGYPEITPDMIDYSSSGGNIDTIITVGVTKLSDLDNIYSNNVGLFSEKPIINVDNNRQNTQFGKINFVKINSSSCSEVVLSLISSLGLPINGDISTNLLAGVSSATKNFSSAEVNENTFEAAAFCMRNGARKISVPSTFAKTPTFSKQQFQPPQAPPFFSKQPPFIKTSPPVKQKQSPPQMKEEAPPDWLKPKIYKGSTLL